MQPLLKPSGQPIAGIGRANVPLSHVSLGLMVMAGSRERERDDTSYTR